MTETPAATACPSCGAALRPGAPWCTLCYTDLRPAPEPAPAPYIEPVSTPLYGPAARDPLTQPLVDFLPYLPPAHLAAAAPPAVPTQIAAPVGLAKPDAASTATWPCTRCDALNPFSAGVCSTCGGPFLSALRDEQPVLVLPLVGDIGGMSRGKRLGLAVGAVVALLMVMAALAMLFSGGAEGGQPNPDVTISDTAP